MVNARPYSYAEQRDTKRFRPNHRGLGDVTTGPTLEQAGLTPSDLLPISSPNMYLPWGSSATTASPVTFSLASWFTNSDGTTNWLVVGAVALGGALVLKGLMGRR
jgi:hypothetical protein